MTAKRARDGVGGRAHRRASQALRRRTRLEGLVCGWCGEPIDTTLPVGDRMSFTADHPEAVAGGGALVGQQLVPMHWKCNAAKNDSVAVDLDEFKAT